MQCVQCHVDRIPIGNLALVFSFWKSNAHENLALLFENEGQSEGVATSRKDWSMNVLGDLFRKIG